jgi:ribosomal protein S18 acetylase RimI-like enzyme
VQLHVEAKNEAAIRLYAKLGLRETRRIRGYYKGVTGGGDAIEMRGIVSVQESTGRVEE